MRLDSCTTVKIRNKSCYLLLVEFKSNHFLIGVIKFSDFLLRFLHSVHSFFFFLSFLFSFLLSSSYLLSFFLSFISSFLLSSFFLPSFYEKDSEPSAYLTGAGRLAHEIPRKRLHFLRDLPQLFALVLPPASKLPQPPAQPEGEVERVAEGLRDVWPRWRVRGTA